MKPPVEKKFRAAASHLAAGLLLLGLGVALYAPPPGAAAWRYFGISDDPWIYVWFLNWWPYALAHHLPLLHTGFIDAPFGTGLAWKTGIIGLAAIAAPFTLKFGALATYNGLMLIAPGLAGWAAYLAAAELTLDRAAALAAGLVFGFSSYMLGQMQDHLNLVFIAPVPFSLFLCIAAWRHGWGRWRLAVGLGLTLAFMFLVSQEVFASLVVLGGLGWTLLVLAGPARAVALGLAPGLWRGVALALLLLSPLILTMLRHFSEAAHFGALPQDYETDLLGFLLPPPWVWAGGRLAAPLTALFKGQTEGNGAYIGLPLLLLLACIWRAHRGDPRIRLAAQLALAAAIASLGPYMAVLGHYVGTAPWLLLYRLPFFSVMLPMRFTLYMWLAIAMLLALWLARPGRGARRYALLAVCLAFLLPQRHAVRAYTTLHVPAMLTDGSLAPGSRLMILPEGPQGPQMGLQFAAGLRFSLVGEGYLGNGDPLPFARWPLYYQLFHGTDKDVRPDMLAAFLATYHPDAVLVLPDASSAALPGLLTAAGWELARADADASLYRPPPGLRAPSLAAQEAFINEIPAERRAKWLRGETLWVHRLCRLSASTGWNRDWLFAEFARHGRTPVPPASIGCAP